MAPNFELLMVDKKYQCTLDAFISAISLGRNGILKNIISNFSLEKLKKAVNDSEIKEYSVNYFNKTNIINTNYIDIEIGDYERFYHLCDLYSLNSKKILSQVIDQDSYTPNILFGKNGMYYLISGNMELCAYKVLNLFPVIREISVDFNISKK